ncbi:MAG: hypothetical protein MUF14_04060 [Hyphomonadaceae bacterium]|jgi:hypothetical protein|nr:hypothetical protein [Hyphomonadaceae bacterium]
MMVALLLAQAATRQAVMPLDRVPMASRRPPHPQLAVVRNPRPATLETSNRETAS